jgi:hypothetical protein
VLQKASSDAENDDEEEKPAKKKAKKAVSLFLPSSLSRLRLLAHPS